MTRGGYQRERRLATTLDEIKIEALVGLRSRSRHDRDRSFAEIARLAAVCARFDGP